MELWERLALQHASIRDGTILGTLDSGGVRIAGVRIAGVRIAGVDDECIDSTLVIFMILGHDNSNTLHW